MFPLVPTALWMQPAEVAQQYIDVLHVAPCSVSTAKISGQVSQNLLLCMYLQLSAYGKLEAGEEAMKQEILARGPIVCGIACPNDFTYHYHSSKNGGELSM